MANPIQLLLNVLVRRSEEQNSLLIADDKKTQIATKQYVILSAKVETEKNVGSLAQNVLDNNPNLEKTRREQLEKIAANSKDKIDLFIECELELNGKDKKNLQIIIENKIDSPEGGTKQGKNDIGDVEYDAHAQQTTRYFLGTKYPDNRGDVIQLYVYLTPLPSRELDNFETLEKNNDKRIRNDKNFIQINYQDIVDGITLPMLASSSLSSRSRFFMKEFVNEVIFPSLEGNVFKQSIAISCEYSKTFTNIWDKYKDLIIDAATTAAERDFWFIDDTYYDHQPTKELRKLLQEKGVQDITKQPNFKTLKEKATGMYNVGQKGSLNQDTSDLLTTFWDENKRFLSAIMNGIDEEKRKNIECLLVEATKRDTTKYNVYFDNKKINKQPLNKGETAHAIVAKWAELKKNFNIDDIRNAFPVKWNSYYANGKLFKYLIYKKDPNSEYSYDGTNKLKGESVPSKSNFDFDKGEKFDIENNSKEKFILLKMWRKDGLEKFIKYAKGLTVFKGKLEVQEA